MKNPLTQHHFFRRHSEVITIHPNDMYLVVHHSKLVLAPVLTGLPISVIYHWGEISPLTIPGNQLKVQFLMVKS